MPPLDFTTHYYLQCRNTQYVLAYSNQIFIGFLERLRSIAKNHLFIQQQQHSLSERRTKWVLHMLWISVLGFQYSQVCESECFFWSPYPSISSMQGSPTYAKAYFTQLFQRVGLVYIYMILLLTIITVYSNASMREHPNIEALLECLWVFSWVRCYVYLCCKALDHLTWLYGVESAKLSPQVKKKTFSIHSCISIQICTHSYMHVQCKQHMQVSLNLIIIKYCLITMIIKKIQVIWCHQPLKI